MWVAMTPIHDTAEGFTTAVSSGAIAQSDSTFSSMHSMRTTISKSRYEANVTSAEARNSVLHPNYGAPMHMDMY
jgi:hypothetical protein